MGREPSRLVRGLVRGGRANEPNGAGARVAKTHALATAALLLHRRSLAALERGVALTSLPLGAMRRALATFRGADPDVATERFRDLQQLLDGLLKLGAA